MEKEINNLKFWSINKEGWGAGTSKFCQNEIRSPHLEPKAVERKGEEDIQGNLDFILVQKLRCLKKDITVLNKFMG